jgi:two-component system response regulator TctD
VTACPTCGQSFPENIWRFDVEHATLLIDGRAFKLSPRKAAILGLLLKHFGRPVHRDSFIMAIYGDDEPADAENCLEVHLVAIRRMLRGTRLRLNTHFGFGYSITLGAKE